MFKRGDIVRCTKSSIAWGADDTPAYIEGETYEVLEADAEDIKTVKDNHGSTTNGWRAQFFELANPRSQVIPVDNSASLQIMTGRARGSDVQPTTEAGVRTFGTGATRDLDANKLDYEGFLSPLVLKRYAEHMHRARRMPDGSMRDSDNWQLGIPQEAYVKSLFRHFFSVWSIHRGIPTFTPSKVPEDLEAELCAVLFNASGMLHELLKAKREAL